MKTIVSIVHCPGTIKGLSRALFHFAPNVDEKLDSEAVYFVSTCHLSRRNSIEPQLVSQIAPLGALFVPFINVTHWPLARLDSFTR
jgi:hypothetical protein